MSLTHHMIKVLKKNICIWWLSVESKYMSYQLFYITEPTIWHSCPDWFSHITAVQGGANISDILCHYVKTKENRQLLKQLWLKWDIIQQTTLQSTCIDVWMLKICNLRHIFFHLVLPLSVVSITVWPGLGAEGHLDLALTNTTLPAAVLCYW